MMRWFSLRNFPDVGPHTTPFPTSKSTRVLYIFLFWESLESNLGLSFQFVWNRMNLDPLSFALAEISYSVASLTKKNYKPSVAEINHVSRNTCCLYWSIPAVVLLEGIVPVLFLECSNPIIRRHVLLYTMKVMAVSARPFKMELGEFKQNVFERKKTKCFVLFQASLLLKITVATYLNHDHNLNCQLT